jgi:hypothetical protein
MKSGKKSMKKSIKKQNINKIKWDHQNPQVVSCQILNIKKKYWIEWQNQKEKSNSQKNPNHKKNKENQFSTNLMIMDEIF